MKTQLLKHPAFLAGGLVLAVATVCPAVTPITLYDTLTYLGQPYIRGDGAAITHGSSWSALAARFTVSGPAAILTGFDLAIFNNTGETWNAPIPGNLTVSIYRDSIGVPGGPGALGALVASTTFVDPQPVCVPGSENGVPDNCVPIFSATMPGNVLLTPGNYWLALTTSCACQVGWLYTAGEAEGNAYLDPTTNLWGSLIDNPWGFTVYGTPEVASGTLTPDAGSPFQVLGGEVETVAVGDFNGDGKPDIATTGIFSGTVLLGDGAGAFKPGPPGSSFPVPLGYLSLVTGDFNGDGKLDLAVTDFDGISVTVFLGNGAGGFPPAAPQYLGLGYLNGFQFPLPPQSVAAVDFNGDGKLDLVLANGSSEFGGVRLLVGDGTGKFTEAPNSPISLPGSSTSVAVGDFNQDGKPDLAIASRFGNFLYVLLGDGTGNFTPAPGSPFAAGPNPISVAVGDFNQDGKPDLAIANGPGGVTVLLGDGSGGFTPAALSPFPTLGGPISVQVGDFNGDGKLDLITANSFGSSVTVLLGNGAGGFTPATGLPFPVGAYPVAVAVADFNLDGRLDVVTPDGTPGSVTVLLGASAPTASALSTTAAATIPFATSVPLTLTVSNPGTFFDAPTGTATFQDGGTTIGTAIQTSSPYTFTASGLSLGAHTFTASYGGDSRNIPSASSPPITIQVTNTAVGSGIIVQPVDPTSGGTPVTLTFSSVTQAGSTTVTTSSSGPPPPSGFSLGNPAVYYNLSTTAAYTPPITICINYSGITFTAAPALFHFESGVWTDVTTSVDTVNDIICGAVSSLSPFALFRHQAGIQALSPTAANALLVSGNSVVNISGEIAANSNSTKAMVVSGASKVTAKAVQIVGGFSAPSGAISPAPVTGAASRPDPLATLQAPSYSGCNFTNFKLTGNGSAALTPGVYCGGITVAGNATATFAAGAYILNGGGLNVSGNASLTGQGLTFYNTGSGSSYEPVTISGSVKINLSAPTSGAMTGILFFQDRNVSSGSANTLSGDIQAQLGGALYFPTTGLVVSGNSGSSGGGTVIIANTVEFSGNAYLR